MSYRHIKPTYIAFPAAAVPEAARLMLEQWAEHQEWWHSIPFGCLTIVILAFGFGVLVQDLINEHSSLRHNWREWRKVFDVVTMHAGYIQEGVERITIVCLLKFRKDIKNASLVVRVIVPLSFKSEEVKVTHQELLDTVVNGEKRLTLGNIPIIQPGSAFARHAVWGERTGEQVLKPGQFPIYASRNIIEISVGPQTYRVYAHVLDEKRREQAYVYLLNEDELPDFKN